MAVVPSTLHELAAEAAKKEELRLEAYRRLAAVTSAAEVDDMTPRQAHAELRRLRCLVDGGKSQL